MQLEIYIFESCFAIPLIFVYTCVKLKYDYAFEPALRRKSLPITLPALYAPNLCITDLSQSLGFPK